MDYYLRYNGDFEAQEYDNFWTAIIGAVSSSGQNMKARQAEEEAKRRQGEALVGSILDSKQKAARDKKLSKTLVLVIVIVLVLMAVGITGFIFYKKSRAK